MFINIIFFFLILITLSFLLSLSHSAQNKEAFFNFPDTTEISFIKDSANKFNNLTNTINLTNPAVPITPESAINIKLALHGLAADSVDTNGNYKLTSKSTYELPQDVPNTFKAAKSCEAAPNTCDAFDDPTFAANCGLSFDIKGKDSAGNPHIGGLFVSQDDRQRQTDRAQNVISTGSAPYDPYKVYQPTLGKAKSGTFALTKDQCIVVKEKIDCATKQTFSSPNCAQCYTSQNFARVGPETGRIPSALLLFGTGVVTVTSADNSINLAQTTLDINSPVQVTIPGNAEGTQFVINVQGNDTAHGLCYIAGFIQGQTPNGTFKLDLMSLIQSDTVTNSKPRINGSITANGFRCLTIIPGNGQTTMNLSCLMPFSFLNMYDGDALTCDNGPIITQAASATFLDSDPCFSKANAPGNYKLECLQNRWIELGGQPQGTGYPSTKALADALQIDGSGKPLDIDTIITNIAPKITSAITGLDANGKQLTLADWNTLSLWATGVPINTPCDGSSNATNGPLSQECLSYLYLNQGVNSHIGPTYTMSPSNTASMLGQTTANTYCQPGTIIDPATSSGLKFGQSLGGINSVKQTYDQINRLANDNTQPNAARATAINQCYGVSLDPVSNNTATGPVQVFSVGPGYNYTQAQASQVCAEYGAQVATTAQLMAAQAAGADWCSSGWVSDSTNAMYPITTSLESGCGNGSQGIKSFVPEGGKAAVNCYGPKPLIGDYPSSTILPFNQTSWDQTTAEVFAVGPGYNYTQTQAPQVCAEYGAQVATIAQLTAAQAAGADWCSSGWVSDSTNAMYPITTSTEAGCGNGKSGVMTFTSQGGKAGVNCYGTKPAANDALLPFNQSKWSQKS